MLAKINKYKYKKNIIINKPIIYFVCVNVCVYVFYFAVIKMKNNLHNKIKFDFIFSLLLCSAVRYDFRFIILTCVP